MHNVSEWSINMTRPSKSASITVFSSLWLYSNCLKRMHCVFFNIKSSWSSCCYLYRPLCISYYRFAWLREFLRNRSIFLCLSSFQITWVNDMGENIEICDYWNSSELISVSAILLPNLYYEMARAMRNNALVAKIAVNGRDRHRKDICNAVLRETYMKLRFKCVSHTNIHVRVCSSNNETKIKTSRRIGINIEFTCNRLQFILQLYYFPYMEDLL